MKTKFKGMEVNKRIKEYGKYINSIMPKSKHLKNSFFAFVIGGLICCLGEAINMFGVQILLMNQGTAGAFQALILVFIGATLTGVGVYKKIGKIAGAGSIVPITGFANSIVSPAIEFRREGYIAGVGAKLFILAGPVLVNGISASVLVGLIYHFFVL